MASAKPVPRVRRPLQMVDEKEDKEEKKNPK
jgi:hypothetical protein